MVVMMAMTMTPNVFSPSESFPFHPLAIIFLLVTLFHFKLASPKKKIQKIK
jgi:hypothetical protein